MHINRVEDPLSHVRLNIYLTVLSVADRQMKPFDKGGHQFICLEHKVVILIKRFKKPILSVKSLIGQLRAIIPVPRRTIFVLMNASILVLCILFGLGFLFLLYFRGSNYNEVLWDVHDDPLE